MERRDVENAPELAQAFENSVTISSTNRKKVLLERNERREDETKTDNGSETDEMLVPPKSFRTRALDPYSRPSLNAQSCFGDEMLENANRGRAIESSIRSSSRSVRKSFIVP